MSNTQHHEVMSVGLKKGQYLGEKLRGEGVKLPRRAYLSAGTGTGKTTYFCKMALEDDERVIIAASVTPAVKQLQDKYDDGEGRVAVAYDREKTPIDAKTRLIICTYDQIANVSKQIERDKWRLVIDEGHNIALANYRRAALRRVIAEIANPKWLQVVVMSGTPLYSPLSCFDDFVFVKVEHWKRTQQAVMVRCENDKISRYDVALKIALSHAESTKPTVIFLNNKSGGLDKCIAGLVAGGVDASTIYALNSDSKYDSIGEQVTTHETLPDNCKFFFCTSVFVESVNLHTELGAVIILSSIHPAYAEQLVNRQRGDVAPDIVYVVTSGQGGGFNFNIKGEYRYTMTSHAAELVERQNKLDDELLAQGVQPYSEGAKRLFGGAYGGMMRREAERWTVDELGVVQHITEATTRYTSNNPIAFKNMAIAYGWVWLPDQYGDEPPEVDQKRVKAIYEERSNKRREDYLKRVADIHAKGATGVEVEIMGRYAEGKIKRVASSALELEKLTGDWDMACKLLATANDSTQAIGHLFDLVTANQLRESGEPFVERLAAEFAEGETLTRDERFERWRAIYESDLQMAGYVTEVKRFSFSNEPQARIRKQTIDQLIRLLYEVQSKRRRVEGGTERYYEVVGLDPLGAAVRDGDEMLLKGYELRGGNE
ncbi:MAG TPA: DEAD/DEAH box helicase family protein [Anaerolineae bacterium]|nr:DEAD/DEAH box helicase family protein [Anaerolineae bacterium]